MDCKNTPKKSESIIQHIRNSNNQNIEKNDLNLTQKNDEAKRKNQKCQNSANNSENVCTEPMNVSSNLDSEEQSPEHFSLDALESTKVAVAQFAAAALSKGANESSIKDLTMLQSALFTLQHQQVFQMQLIEQLQYQLANSNTNKEKHRNNLQPKLKKDESIELDREDTSEDVKLKTMSTEW